MASIPFNSASLSLLIFSYDIISAFNCINWLVYSFTIEELAGCYWPTLVSKVGCIIEIPLIWVKVIVLTAQGVTFCTSAKLRSFQVHLGFQFADF